MMSGWLSPSGIFKELLAGAKTARSGGWPESGVGRLSGVVKREEENMIPHIQQTQSEMTKLDCLSTFKASGRDAEHLPFSKNSPASLWFALYRSSAIMAKALPSSLHLRWSPGGGTEPRASLSWRNLVHFWLWPDVASVLLVFLSPVSHQTGRMRTGQVINQRNVPTHSCFSPWIKTHPADEWRYAESPREKQQRGQMLLSSRVLVNGSAQVKTLVVSMLPPN